MIRSQHSVYCNDFGKSQRLILEGLISQKLSFFTWCNLATAYSKSRAEQSRAEQSRAEQSRAEQSRAYVNKIEISFEKRED